MSKVPDKPKDKQLAESSTGIPSDVARVIKDLPPDKQKVIVQALSITQLRSGPLPSSEEIKVYNEVIPNGGDRLMTTVEKQLEHRVQIENKGVDRSFNQSSTGQWMAFAIAIIFGAMSWDLAKSGHDVTATIIGGIDLVGLVAVFITGRIIKK